MAFRDWVRRGALPLQRTDRELLEVTALQDRTESELVFLCYTEVGGGAGKTVGRLFASDRAVYLTHPGRFYAPIRIPFTSMRHIGWEDPSREDDIAWRGAPTIRYLLNDDSESTQKFIGAPPGVVERLRDLKRQAAPLDLPEGQSTGFHPDPTGRYVERKCDGTQWTDVVLADEVEHFDPLSCRLLLDDGASGIPVLHAVGGDYCALKGLKKKSQQRIRLGHRLREWLSRE